MKALYKQFNSVPTDYLKEKIDLFINEDKAEQDLSTLHINQSPKIIKAHIIAEEEMVFCGQNIIETVFKKNKITPNYRSINSDKPNQGSKKGQAG